VAKKLENLVRGSTKGKKAPLTILENRYKKLRIVLDKLPSGNTIEDCIRHVAELTYYCCMLKRKLAKSAHYSPPDIYRDGASKLKKEFTRMSSWVSKVFARGIDSTKGEKAQEELTHAMRAAASTCLALASSDAGLNYLGPLSEAGKHERVLEALKRLSEYKVSLPHGSVNSKELGDVLKRFLNGLQTFNRNLFGIEFVHFQVTDRHEVATIRSTLGCDHSTSSQDEHAEADANARAHSAQLNASLDVAVALRTLHHDMPRFFPLSKSPQQASPFIINWLEGIKGDIQSICQHTAL